MIKAIIFDFDGIIVDTEVIWYDILREWLFDKHDYEISEREFAICVGSNDTLLFENLKRHIGPSVSQQAFKRDIEGVFEKKSDAIDLMPGVLDTIKEAKRLGYKVALATSSKKERPLYHLKRFGLLDHFDAITTGSDVMKIKPNPELYLRTLEKLNIKGDEAIVIEDSENGLIAATKANIKTIIVPNDITKHIVFSDHYLKIDSLEKLDVESLNEKI